MFIRARSEQQQSAGSFSRVKGKKHTSTFHTVTASLHAYGIKPKQSWSTQLACSVLFFSTPFGVLHPPNVGRDNPNLRHFLEHFIDLVKMAGDPPRSP